MAEIGRSDSRPPDSFDLSRVGMGDCGGSEVGVPAWTGKTFQLEDGVLRSTQWWEVLGRCATDQDSFSMDGSWEESGLAGHGSRSRSVAAIRKMQIS